MKRRILDFPIQVWMQAVVNGLALGWLYILMALGLTWILSIMGILQLAHGEVYMVGAYVVFYLSRSFGLNLYLAIFLSMVIMALFGVFLERFLFRARPQQDPVLAPIIISTGLTLILTSGAVVGFGLYDRSVPRLLLGSFNIFGGAVPKDRIFAIAFSAAMLILLYLFLKRTRWGQAIVASAQNREGALLRGINPNQMAMISMAIGCALAALAGALAGSILLLTPYMGSQPLVKGLVIIVLGGLGSLLGATIGGILLGLMDGIIPVIFGSAAAAVAPLIIVILILLLRPKGMFGHE
jgi:branched-chain amino acid transport system permease protein